MNAVVPSRLEPKSKPASPDPRVSEQVSHAWQRSGYRDLRGLKCEFDGGIVTIRGQVGSYFLKQMAQAIAARVEGVKRINNQLHVA